MPGEYVQFKRMNCRGPMKQYEIRDPVYGFITFNDWEKGIIDHPAFQRLRRIKQLALTEMVYPGAVHTRFEHSLGVMHLATIMYDSIVNNNKRMLEDHLSYNKIGLEKDRQLVRLAALLHDIGHAPFSHASEDILPMNPTRNKPYNHEDYTARIIKNILRDVIEDHPINKRNCDKEIMIISGEEEGARPLSYFSTIVKNIGEVKQIRIYVKKEDRKRAKEALK